VVADELQEAWFEHGRRLAGDQNQDAQLGQEAQAKFDLLGRRRQ